MRVGNPPHRWGAEGGMTSQGFPNTAKKPPVEKEQAAELGE